MPSAAPSTLIERHRLLAHVLLPAVLSLVLMGFYFSGSPELQSIVAPTIEGLHPFSWREFGALELLQNVALIAIIVLLADSARRAGTRLMRLALVVAAVGFVFVLLEEVDYGRHWYEYVTGDVGPLSPDDWDRNLHNRRTGEGVQYARYMRFGASVFIGIAFVFAPLLLQRSRRPLVQLLLPSRWMIATVVLMVLLSDLAHALEDAGRATIAGVPGNLERNISEFRELVLYYLFGLYCLELNGRLIRSRRGTDGRDILRRHEARAEDACEPGNPAVAAGGREPGLRGG